MEHQRFYLHFAVLITLSLSINALSISERVSSARTDAKEAVKEEDGLKNAIVLIGLDEIAKGFNGYGVIPILEKDVIGLFDANSTLADKIVGDSRSVISSTENSESQSRLLPLITTPKKALLLFALHETLLKSNKSQIDKNCVVLSKDDLNSLLTPESSNPRKIASPNKSS